MEVGVGPQKWSQCGWTWPREGPSPGAKGEHRHSESVREAAGRHSCVLGVLLGMGLKVINRADLVVEHLRGIPGPASRPAPTGAESSAVLVIHTVKIC